MKTPCSSLSGHGLAASRSGTGGYAMLIAMLLLSGLVATGMTVYTRARQSLRSAGNHVRGIQSYYQAQAGANYVLDRLGADVAGDVVTLDQPVVTVSYQPPTGYAFDPVTSIEQVAGGEAYLFQITGHAGTARTVFEIVLRAPAANNPFGDFFSDDKMTLSGGASITGNARGNNDIVNSGGSQIHGDAMPGPGYSVSDPSNVTGETTPATETISIPPIDPAEVAAAMAVNNNGAIDPAYYDAATKTYSQSGGNYTLPAGTYYFTEFNTSGGAITSIGGPVKIYCSGKIVVSGGGFTNPSNDPDDLILNSVAVDQVVEWSGTSDCHARVYGPYVKETKVTGGGTFTGSIITKGKLTASGGSILNGSGGGGMGGGSGLQVSAWREVF